MTRIKILLLSIFLCAVPPALAENDAIQTMFHRGHPIKDFAVSYDEKYIFTRSDGEVCVWDLNSRMLMATLPMFTVKIFAHPTDSRLFYADTKVFTLKGLERMPNVTDDSIDWSRPTDFRLFYNDIEGFKFQNTEDSSVAANDLIDWTKGKCIGKVSSDRMPKYSAGSDYTFAKNGDMLMLYTALGNNLAPVGTIGGRTRSARTVCSNNNDSLLLTSGKGARLWDLRHASLIGTISNSERSNDACFQPGTDSVILLGTDAVELCGGNSMPISGAGNICRLSICGDKTIAMGLEHLYMSVSGKPFYKLPAFRDVGKGRLFSTISRPYGNGKFLIGTNNTAVSRINDSGASLIEGSFNSDQPLRLAENIYNKISDIKISPDDDYAVIASIPNDIAILDLKTMRYVSEMAADYDDLEFVTACEILPDGTIVAGTTLGKLNFWKKGQTKSFRQSREHHAEIMSISLSSDSTRMFTSDRLGQITIWDVRTQEPIVYVYQVADDTGTDYMFLTPDHYYKATPGISRHINFVKDGKAYAFEQFDLRNNRPDIVLSRLGGNPAEIELLNKAWKKRLRRAGISEESLSADYHVPTAKVNRKEMPFITTESTIALDVAFADSMYDLSEISVTVNGVPVLSPGKRRVAGRAFNLKENIALASGNNEITVWCSNVKGTSSLRETLNVTYTPQKPVKPNLYIVAAGVSGYADSRYNLGYAAKDAGDFVEALEKRAGQNFAQVRTLTLTDSQVTAASLDKIRSFLAGSRPDDVALMFFAGHGVLDSELEYYLGAYDMDFANPSSGGIRYDDFMGVFDGVPALNRACFIDACHSGELDKEDYFAVNTVAMPAGEELVFRAAGQNVSAKEDIERVNAILSDMFRDTRWGVGATVLSSAGGGELAVESPEWNNGLFTYCLLKGIQGDAADADHNGKTSLSEWIDYTRRHVTDMSEGRQSPTLRSQNYHYDLEIK